MMQKRLIIYLTPALSRQASWILLNESNKIIESVERGELEKLSVPKDYDVIVVVPAEDVLLTHAQLPKMSRQRLLQALPFALEEQLIDDVSELHFAVGDYQEDGTVPVAVVSQQKMTAWLSLFAQFGIAPRAFIPDIFALDYMPNSWTINTYNQFCVVRTGKFSGFACEQDNLETLLQLKLAEEAESNSINLIRSQHSEIEMLERIAQEFPTLAFINLLQGGFHPKPQTSKTRKIWLNACYLGIILIALIFVRDLVSYIILHRQTTKIETAINKIYRANFPQATAVVAPRDRMTQKLKTLAGAASSNNFLGLISTVGKSLPQGQVRIVNLDFREKQMTLEISAASFENVDTFMKALTQQGLSVKQQNAAEAGDQVKATLLIRAGAA